MTETNSLFFRNRSLFRYAYGIAESAGRRYTERRVRPFALRRLIAFLPPAVLMRFRNPCRRFCFSLLFCAVVSDIACSFDGFRIRCDSVVRTEAYYNPIRAYVKGKNPPFCGVADAGTLFTALIALNRL